MLYDAVPADELSAATAAQLRAGGDCGGNLFLSPHGGDVC